MSTISRVGVGAGLGWISEGFSLFGRCWLKFIVTCVAVFVVSLVLALIPILGQIVQLFLMVCGGAVGILAFRSVQERGDFSLGDVFERVKPKLVQLCIIALVNFGLTLLMGAIAALMIGSAVSSISVAGGELSAPSLGAGVWGSFLVVMIFGVLFWMANAFAVPLVALSNLSAIEALKSSITAYFVNLIPLFVYSVIVGIVGFLVMLFTFGLGLLIFIPVTMAATLVATQELFPEARGQ